MTTDEVMDELRAMGSDPIKKVLTKHGAREPFFGVKVEDLKKLQKRIKRDHQLALDLYGTGNSDAMYLAGLIVDDRAMTPDDLQRWAQSAYWSLLSESTVPWVAAEGPHGWDIALRWIASSDEQVASCGWATLSGLVSVRPDAEMDIAELGRLLERVASTIHEQPNRVRSAMNGFVIAAGSYVAALTDRALTVAAAIGAVRVDVGDTACKVPNAAEYIGKVMDRGSIGKKRKSAKC